MQHPAEYWIKKLDLIQLPEEGGLYRETYRSDMIFVQKQLPNSYQGPRPAITDIYYLLQGKTFSAFHRIRSDEIWHYHAGHSLLVHIIETNGTYHIEPLGFDADRKEKLRVTLPRGCWFAAEMKDKSPDQYVLVSCVVAPGFEFEDFELGKRDVLLNLYPEYKEVIEKLTRN